MVMFNHTTGSFRGEPNWRCGRTVRWGMVPDDVSVWLFDADSLTRRLRKCCQRFHVEVLAQAWRRPMLCERRVLGMDDRGLALIRQVRLYCDGEPKVYARTVMPKTSLTGRRRRLAHLGGRPLGEMLFRDRTMRRGDMEVAQVSPGAWLPANVKQMPSYWGRRSVFSIGDKPLLVNEVFLPPLPADKGFRIKRKI